jgi:hypothetical protein
VDVRREEERIKKGSRSSVGAGEGATQRPPVTSMRRRQGKKLGRKRRNGLGFGR